MNSILAMIITAGVVAVVLFWLLILWWALQCPLTRKYPNPAQWVVHFTHLLSTQGKLGVKKEWIHLVSR